jgi:hypothetical protein
MAGHAAVHGGLDARGRGRGAAGHFAFGGPVQQHTREAAALALDQGAHEAQHLAAALGRQPPDHAEVDEAHAVAGQGQQVAGVGVGVEQAVAQHHLQEGLGAAARQQRAVQRGVMAHGRGRHAGHEVLHQQARPAQGPVDAGHDDLGLVREVPCHGIAVVGLDGEIQLLAQRLGQLARDLARAVA